MNIKVVLGLIGGIVILVAGALFLIRSSSNIPAINNNISGDGPNIPGEPRRFVIGRSDISGYSISVINEQELIDAIQINNIFGRTYIHLDDQTTGERPLENIAFQLTEKAPSVGAEYEDSDYVQLVSGGIIFSFVMSPDELSNPELSNEVLRKIIDYSYRLTYPNNSEDMTNAAVDSVYNSLMEKNSEYIIIEEK